MTDSTHALIVLLRAIADLIESTTNSPPALLKITIGPVSER